MKREKEMGLKLPEQKLRKKIGLGELILFGAHMSNGITFIFIPRVLYLPILNWEYTIGS